MNPSIYAFGQTRQVAARLTADLTEAQWLHIPEGRRNNILWNAGHMVATQQILHYVFSGIEPHVSKAFIAAFRRGTSPTDWDEQPDIDTVRAALAAGPEQLHADYEAGRFQEYRVYTTSTGVHLADLDTAIGFNLYHEGWHASVIRYMLLDLV
ncbi:MAG: DinB family protein [Bacteroidota bacterium]